jgi:hypothetical protein
LRFEERELELLRGAEHLLGRCLAREGRPEQLRQALGLARTGGKLGHASAGVSVSLEEAEVGLLVVALRYAHDEVEWAARSNGEHDRDRRGAVLTAFPELVEQSWHTFALNRELEALTTRLQRALLP